MKNICFSFLIILISIVVATGQAGIVDSLPETDSTYEESYEDNYLADSNTFRVVLLEFDINILKPLEQFYAKNQVVRVGYNLRFMTELKKESGLMVGLDVAFNTFDNYGGSFAEYDGYGNLEEYSYSTKTKLVMTLIDFRYYFDVNWSKFSPYVEGLVGGKYLSAYSSYSHSDSEWHQFSFTRSYGVGFGLHYQVKSNIFVDFKSKYLSGESDTYYVLNEIRKEYDYGIENYNKIISRTEVAYYAMGLVFKF